MSEPTNLKYFDLSFTDEYYKLSKKEKIKILNWLVMLISKMANRL